MILVFCCFALWLSELVVEWSFRWDYQGLVKRLDAGVENYVQGSLKRGTPTLGRYIL